MARRAKPCTATASRKIQSLGRQLEQGDRVCSRLVVSALPDAYVQYWRKRGLGFLSGEFRSAVASVNDFLDSERQPCPQNSSKLPE